MCGQQEVIVVDEKHKLDKMVSANSNYNSEFSEEHVDQDAEVTREVTDTACADRNRMAKKVQQQHPEK